MHDPSERHDESQPQPIREHLWWIVLSPSIWAIHFLACYVTAAIWCEKVGSNSDSGWLLGLVGGYTTVAVVAISVIAGWSLRSYRRRDQSPSYDSDDPSDRTHFIGFTAFLLSLLSLVATFFTALAMVIVRSCD